MHIATIPRLWLTATRDAARDIRPIEVYIVPHIYCIYVDIYHDILPNLLELGRQLEELLVLLNFVSQNSGA